MTREEQIKQAAESNLDVSFYTPQDGELLKETFYIGAKWADKNPPSPWISIKDDLPSFHSDLVENAIATKNVIVLLDDGRIRETQLLCGHWKEYDKKVTHWMRLPELPKE